MRREPTQSKTIASDENLTEAALLGAAIIAAQYVELALGGIAAHANHLPAAQGDRRLRNLKPDLFLRAEPGDLKVTLGQFVEAFGDTFMIRTEELVQFVADRNLIAHDYIRAFKMKNAGAPLREDPIQFLTGFIKRAQYWRSVLQGFIHALVLAAAEKEGRQSEVVTSAKNQADLKQFRQHVAAYVRQRTTQGATSRDSG